VASTKGLTQALARDIVQVVKADPASRERIISPTGGFHWAGAHRNARLQRENRFEQKGPVARKLLGQGDLTGAVMELCTPIEIDEAREEYVCINIAKATSMALQAAALSSRYPLLKQCIETVGTISNDLPHKATAIRLKPGYTNVKPLHVRNQNKALDKFKPGERKAGDPNWDFIFDWWYSLDIDNPRIFLTEEDFKVYHDFGIPRGIEYRQYKADLSDLPTKFRKYP
jgi:hypothetical protein